MASEANVTPRMDDLGLLGGLLEQYSPTGSEAGAVTFLVNTLNGLGYRAHVDGAGNAVGTIGSGPREILLLGHIDTVPGFIPVHQGNGRIYGRGSVDAKGPLASFAAAGARARISPDWRVTVIGAVGEEGNSRGAKFLCQHYPAPEMVLIGEPSGWDHVTLGYKGSLWVKYTLNRHLAHTASRSNSACEGAVAFWNRLSANVAAWNAGRERVFNQLTPSLRGMQSDLDGFTETASLDINLRLPLELDLAGLRALLEDVAAAEMPPDGEYRLDLIEEGYIPAYRTEKNTALVRGLLAGIRKAGGQPGFSLKTGTADMNLVAPAWSCPTAAYGPGDSNLDHTPGEFIEVGEYLTGIAVLTHAIEKIQGIV
jgi:LysW-gamma-L-lysine carboxypeptidase